MIAKTSNKKCNFRRRKKNYSRYSVRIGIFIIGHPRDLSLSVEWNPSVPYTCDVHSGDSRASKWGSLIWFRETQASQTVEHLCRNSKRKPRVPSKPANKLTTKNKLTRKNKWQKKRVYDGQHELVLN